jgi:hypothetical protein
MSGEIDTKRVSRVKGNLRNAVGLLQGRVLCSKTASDHAYDAEAL